MPRIITLLVTLVSFLLTTNGRTEDAAPDQIQWQAWSPDIFLQAQKQHRLVLLDLEAVWCHWCHVMDTKTYSDPAVIRLIQQNFIAVRVDQDSRPDLSNRYGDFGWPATILFDSKGRELAKRQGYLPKEEMGAILAAFVKDPTPGPSVHATPEISGNDSALTPSQRTELEKRFHDNYDIKEAGWGFGHKFLDWYSVDYAMSLARHGDKRAAQMTQATLAAQVNLIDPVWGGVYQYSTDGDWTHQHFEKLLQFQAENMRIYALASLLWPPAGNLEHARAIEKYVAMFLTSSDGTFYTSQDADVVDGQHSADYFALNDAARRKIGLPRVDTHVYARENGWMIQGFAALFNATGDAEALSKAERSANAIVQEQSLEGGGFRHGTNDQDGPYLGDTLAMGQAFLALYGSTGDRAWLARAKAASDFIDKHFRPQLLSKVKIGYVTSGSPVGGIFGPLPLSEENVELVRFANLLFHYTGDNRYRDMAKFALAYLSSPLVIKESGNWTAGLLLANQEFNSEPLHITVVGSRDDPQAERLFHAALALPGSYKQTEWLDVREGPLPNSEVSYPAMKTAVAFLCSGSACSSPLATPEKLIAFFADRNKATGPKN